MEKKNKQNSEEVIFELKGNNILLVSFGGIKQGLGMPVFEFYNLIKDLNCDKVFIRDFNQAWYQNGISEKISSIEDLKKFIEKFILSKQYEKVCFLGNSMGGYAAILFGLMINVDYVLAFSPQTFIDRKRRFFYGDKRWNEQVNRVYNFSKQNKKYQNLKSVFKKNNSFKGTINIYYSLNDKLDKAHSERLKFIDSVKLYPSEKGSHNLVKELKNEGKLLDIIKLAL